MILGIVFSDEELDLLFIRIISLYKILHLEIKILENVSKLFHLQERTITILYSFEFELYR